MLHRGSTLTVTQGVHTQGGQHLQLHRGVNTYSYTGGPHTGGSTLTVTQGVHTQGGPHTGGPTLTATQGVHTCSVHACT